MSESYGAFMGFVLLLLIGVAFLVPWCLNSWKSLILWHVIVSTFITYLTTEIASNTGPAAGAGGVAMYIILILFLHILSCSLKGFKIYKNNGGTLKVLPIYAIIGALSYILILVVISMIGHAVFPSIYTYS